MTTILARLLMTSHGLRQVHVELQHKQTDPVLAATLYFRHEVLKR